MELQRFGIFGGDRRDAGRFPAHRVDVLLAHTDAPSLSQSFERDRRQARPGDGDAVAQARRVLDHLLVKTLSERSEQRDRHGAPDDSEDGEHRAELLTPHVSHHLPQRVFEVEHRYLGPVITSPSPRRYPCAEPSPSHPQAPPCHPERSEGSAPVPCRNDQIPRRCAPRNDMRGNSL